LGELKRTEFFLLRREGSGGGKGIKSVVGGEQSSLLTAVRISPRRDKVGANREKLGFFESSKKNKSLVIYSFTRLCEVPRTGIVSN
jgi:hypothetical protein